MRKLFIAICVVTYSVYGQGLACNANISDSIVADVWRSIQKALELRKPTEAQRLSQLRLKIIDLANAKGQLIKTVQNIITEKSIPGWLETRVKEIPGLQDQIKSLVLSVHAEAKEGGLLAGDPSVKKLTDLLVQKRLSTLCELSTLTNNRFPLSPEVLNRLQQVLQNLEAEKAALDSLDPALTQLISKAQSPQHK